MKSSHNHKHIIIIINKTYYIIGDNINVHENHKS